MQNRTNVLLPLTLLTTFFIYMWKTVSKESKVTVAEMKTYFWHGRVKYHFLCVRYLFYSSHLSGAGWLLVHQTPSCWVGVQLDQTTAHVSVILIVEMQRPPHHRELILS